MTRPQNLVPALQFHSYLNPKLVVECHIESFHLWSICHLKRPIFERWMLRIHLHLYLTYHKTLFHILFKINNPTFLEFGLPCPIVWGRSASQISQLLKFSKARRLSSSTAFWQNIERVETIKQCYKCEVKRSNYQLISLETMHREISEAIKCYSYEAVDAVEHQGTPLRVRVNIFLVV